MDNTNINELDKKIQEEENLFSFVKLDELESEKIDAPKYSYWKSVWRQFKKNKVALAMVVIFIVICAFAFIQPLFSGYDVLNADGANDFSLRYNYPSFKNWFGTDANGHSLFDAVWAAAKTSLSISLLATLITMVVGVGVGLVWGYSKTLDKIMIEVYNVLSNIPTILIVFVLIYTFGSGYWEMLAAMTLTMWVGTAYSLRTQVMIIRDREYNLASETLGTPTYKVIIKNIFPFMISVLVTMLSRTLPAFITYEAFFSFIGVGLGATTPSLGRLIQTYSTNITNHAYLFWIPVSILAIITVSLYLIGQALADASDPRTHM